MWNLVSVLSVKAPPNTKHQIPSAETGNSTEPTSSYANATKQEYSPSQDQAIILQSTDGITIKEYARSPNPNEIYKQYITNKPDLTELLIKIHPLLKERSMKIRIRKLYKKMTHDLSDPTTPNCSSEADSELSNKEILNHYFVNTCF
ncbi:hypothetical protein E2986_14039 [Frieseomelitta varia]|uniref:Uncharacterized protein n=1 Tax=Frieseomelitta varia TaxID=561572 RepID=A0A833W3V8_9HYME|nr:hypothetical protein E2986_14039 [Frieseomelitta varia]